MHRSRHDAAEDAVTPVIGSIIILGITVLGITAVMVWGAPLIQELQDRGAEAAMLGEFREVRGATLILSITDSSRQPRLTIDTGSVAVQDGTRTMISSNHYNVAGNEACDMHVQQWGSSGATGEVIVEFTGCGTIDVNLDTTPCALAAGESCFRVFRVSGNQVDEVDITSSSAGATFAVDTTNTMVVDADITTGDWLFELANADRSTTYTQAWLMDSDALVWELESATDRQLWLEGGAVFAKNSNTIFLQEHPALSEQAFNTNDYVLRLPIMSGTSAVQNGPAAPLLLLQLTGNHLRTSENSAYMLRWDWEGTMAESWCNTMKLRNNDLTASAAYAEDTGYECAGTQARKSLTFTSPTGVVAGCTANDCFGFEFIHARITTTF